jgi:hypothetical protein
LVFGGDGAPAVERAEEGLLPGRPPGGLDAGGPPDDAAQRYARMMDHLHDERIVAPEELEAALLDAVPGSAGAPGIHNGATRHGIVFEPAQGRIRVSARGDDGAPTAFRAFTFQPRAGGDAAPVEEAAE